MKRTSLYSLALFLVLIALWEWSVVQFNIRELLLPPPSAIAQNFIVNMLNGYLLPHIAATSIEIFAGFFLGSILGIGLGFVVSQSEMIKGILQPYIIASQAVPKLALAPLFVLWFGYGYSPKIMIVALICFFPLFESTVTGLSLVEREKVDLFRSLRASSYQIMIKLRLPTAVPYIFSGLRVAMVLSVVGAVISEFIGANKGLGAVIITSQYNTPIMFSAFILLTLIGMFLYQIIQLIESLFLKKYHHSRRNQN
jgi:NitT/TauT family transport system permease protein